MRSGTRPKAGKCTLDQTPLHKSPSWGQDKMRFFDAEKLRTAELHRWNCGWESSPCISVKLHQEASIREAQTDEETRSSALHCGCNFIMTSRESLGKPPPPPIACLPYQTTKSATPFRVPARASSSCPSGIVGGSRALYQCEASSRSISHQGAN